MLFDVKKIILYIKRNSLDIYNSEGNLLSQITFPTTILYNLEVINIPSFSNTINTALKPLPIQKAKAILVLSNEVTFFQTYPLNSQKDTQNFTAKIPFETQNLIIKHLTVNNLDVYMAINKNLFESLRSALTPFGIKIETVVPLALYNNQSNPVLEKENISLIFKKTDLLKTYNFLS